MRYNSIIGLGIALVAVALPCEGAAAQSSPQPLHFALQERPQLDPKKELQLAPEKNMQGAAEPDSPLTHEQKTRSAAYKWEAGFLALSALDAATTISCLNRSTCTERNPIWGRHPSTGKIVAAKLGLGLVHFVAFRAIAARDPHTALRAAQISAVVQGGVVLFRLQQEF